AECEEVRGVGRWVRGFGGTNGKAEWKKGGDNEKDNVNRARRIRLCAARRDRAGRRRDLRTAAQTRAAELAHAPPRLQRAAAFAARPDQQVEHQESQAALCRVAGRQIGRRESRSHTAG